jgi:hypothetical protein
VLPLLTEISPDELAKAVPERNTTSPEAPADA